LVITANKGDLMPPQLLKTYPDIGLHKPHHVTQVQGTIGVWQGVGNQDFSLFIGGWHGVQGWSDQAG